MLAFALSIGTWLLDGSIYWLIGTSLGIELSFAGAMVISTITVLGTALPSAPGYLGVFELVAARVAQLLGVAPDQALAFAILAHAFTLVPLALGGAISAAWIGLRARDSCEPNRRQSHDPGRRRSDGRTPACRSRPLTRSSASEACDAKKTD